MADAKPALKVLGYNPESLMHLFAEVAGTSVPSAKDKTHLRFFRDYFGHKSIHAQTIVVEYAYVDHDFLEDFAAYYVRCFESYERKCTRLHFFQADFLEDDFKALLAGEESKLSTKSLQDHYLGFIVVKPLPHCFVGRTCLKPYDDEPERRFFTNVRECKANLFGIPLVVKSLAFQEQDHVVSACATSALWSAFHATSMLFQHALPSPVEITRLATEHTPVKSRVFPHTDGLLVEQMAFAIQRVGLEPWYVDGEKDNPEEDAGDGDKKVEDEDAGDGDADPNDGRVLHPFVLRSSIYAYLAQRIPVILLTALYDEDGTWIGSHACTVTGYSLGGTPPKGDGTRFLSDRIDKLYVHDDQVGPFARMELNVSTHDFFLSTSLGVVDDEEIEALPFALLIPLYNKIRIPFAHVVKLVQAFDAGLMLLMDADNELHKHELEWDIRLVDNNDFKEDIAAAPHLSPKARLFARQASLPRFMWRATAREKDAVIVDVLLDATDIGDGRHLRYLHIADAKLLERVIVLHSAPSDQIGSTEMEEPALNISELLGRFHDDETGALTRHLDAQR